MVIGKSRDPSELFLYLQNGHVYVKVMVGDGCGHMWLILGTSQQWKTPFPRILSSVAAGKRERGLFHQLLNDGWSRDFYVLSTYCVLDTVLGTDDKVMNKTDGASPLVKPEG